MDSWSTICTKNAREMAESCVRDPNVFVESLVKFGSVRGELSMLYAEAVGRKEIHSFYIQPDEIKRHYWREAQKEAKGRMTLEPLKELARALYYLDYLLSKYALWTISTSE